jgi:glutathione synthase/RimK-type ligase-like ATP-grasp enzyme
VDPRTSKVVVLTRDASSDPGIALVGRALEVRGAELAVVETGRFPAQLSLTLELDGNETHAAIGGVSLDGVRAVWVRHLEADALPDDMRPDERAASLRQADAALWALVECADTFVLDPPEALLAAPQKPRVQQLAARLGLDVPRTLVTNSADAVRAFAARCPSGMVCKLVESGSLGLADASFPTLAVSPAELDAVDGLGGLELAPMIFQERLDKALELRVTVVGAQVFVAGVDPGAAVDVRSDPELIRALRRFDDLPPPVVERLLRLLDRLRLNFATADIVRTRDGRWVLLEVNSISFFDHVEKWAGLPISSAVADLLLGIVPPRV